ncbi:MAG: hypothetical protein GY795_47830 [Desulfobacterales bacterium]|nr:hypothetical protein [Desulfobacterales bacterium]
MTSDTNNAYDIGLVIALEEEFEILYSQIEAKREFISEENEYYYFFEYPTDHKQKSYSCVAVFMGTMGPTVSGVKSDRLQARFKPKILVNLGIAGGLDSDVRVGDVVVAEQIDEFLDTAKAVNSEIADKFEIKLSGNVHKSTPRFITHAINLDFSPDNEAKNWTASCRKTLNNLISKEIHNALIENELISEDAKIRTGHLASGSIVGGTEQFTKWLKERDRKYLALEMEAGGIMASSHTRTTETLIIRGISDYGDERKKELDKIGEGALRRYAMHNALDLLWLFMRMNLI